MDISRKLGILVFCGVPAIIGGGIVYGMAGSYIPVAVYRNLALSRSRRHRQQVSGFAKFPV
jgi:hypothetical protein